MPNSSSTRCGTAWSIEGGDADVGVGGVGGVEVTLDEPRAPRQPEVEQEQVNSFGSERGACRRHVIDPVDRVAFEPQRMAQAVADHAVVFHQQQPHAQLQGFSGGRPHAASRALGRAGTHARHDVG